MRGQAGVLHPMGLMSAESLLQQYQHAGASLYLAIWDETPQGTAPLPVMKVSKTNKSGG